MKALAAAISQIVGFLIVSHCMRRTCFLSFGKAAGMFSGLLVWFASSAGGRFLNQTATIAAPAKPVMAAPQKPQRQPKCVLSMATATKVRPSPMLWLALQRP